MYLYEEALSGIYLKQPQFIFRDLFFLADDSQLFVSMQKTDHSCIWQNDWFYLLIVGRWKRVSFYNEWNK